MEHILGENNGIQIKILDYIRNKQFTCTDECFRAQNCELKKFISMEYSCLGFVATEVILSMKNFTDKEVGLYSDTWELVDTKGYSYAAKHFCDELSPPRMVEVDVWNVKPSTQVKFALLFPELEEDSEVSGIIYNDHDGRKIRLEISPLIDEVQKDFSSKIEKAENEKEVNALEKDYELQGTIRDLDLLEKYVFSRFNNTLSKNDVITLDNNIMNTEFIINQKVEKYDKRRLDMIFPRFQKIMSDYHENIVSQKLQEQNNIEFDERISDLYNLSPREFEEWTASLFSALGYGKVTLTPQTADKGIDILAEKDGFKIAVQCKKYKGVVGSPLVQQFLGAMQTSEIEKGFFVTTGTFSIEAEKAVLNMPIELWDKISLKRLIVSALK